MRLASSSLLLAAGLLLMHCSLLEAATKQHNQHRHGRLRPMDIPEAGLSIAAAQSSEAQASTGALVPSCVPKYVSDLVIPPPMPVVTSTLAETRRRANGLPVQTGPMEMEALFSIASAEGQEATSDGPAALKRSDGQEYKLDAGKDSGEFKDEYDGYGKDGFDAAAGDAEAKASIAQATKPLKKNRKSKNTIDDDYWLSIYPNGKYDGKLIDDDSPRVSAEARSSPSPAPAAPAAPQAEPAIPNYVGYDISVRQIAQDVLPTGASPNEFAGCPTAFKPTTVYAYGPANTPGDTFYNWPGYTIEAQRNVETRVRWTNGLVDDSGKYIPHLLKEAIDQTINWANPNALGGDTDSSPCAQCLLDGHHACLKDTECIRAASTSYPGPVPIVTHVQGQNNVYDFSDGYAESWYLPKARNLLGFKNAGSWYQTFKREYSAITGNRWNQGSATFIYNNTSPASTMWYHDNALGVSRLNVYAGLSGFYLIRDKFPSISNGPELPGLPYPAYDGTIDTSLVRELPLAIQDRAFTSDSQLWYPVADLPSDLALPSGPVPPRWIPEFSATVTANGSATNMLMMTVNGKTYPRQVVFPDAYRLRILNAANSRTLLLRFARWSAPQVNPFSTSQTSNVVPFFVVGNDAGFFPQLQPPMTNLVVGPGERYDVVIDFSGVLPGEYVFMLNNGPEPDTAMWDGTNNGVGLTKHTAQIMRFDIQPLPEGQTARPFSGEDQSALNAAMWAQWSANVPKLPSTPEVAVKRMAIIDDKTADGTTKAMFLGTAGVSSAAPTIRTEPVTTSAELNTNQYWDIINLSNDAQPVSLHNMDVRVVGRWRVQFNPQTPLEFNDTEIAVANSDLDPLLQVNCRQEPSGKCSVPKDTVMVLPGTRTRLAFKGPQVAGLYTWQGRMMERGDTQMAVPLCFGSPTYPDPRRPGTHMCPGSS